MSEALVFIEMWSIGGCIGHCIVAIGKLLEVAMMAGQRLVHGTFAKSDSERLCRLTSSVLDRQNLRDGPPQQCMKLKLTIADGAADQRGLVQEYAKL